MAVRRGIEVILYINLGYNDGVSTNLYLTVEILLTDIDTQQGESLPFQGGTNEVVVAKMYKELEPEHKKLLKVFWYTGP